MPGPRRHRCLDPAVLAALGRADLNAHGPVEGPLTGRHRSPHLGVAAEFAEHREYAPGDDPRHLDWKVLARRQRPFIKRFEQETNLTAWLLLDVSGSMRFTSDASRPTKLTFAAMLAATLAHLLSRQGDRVGLMTLTTQAAIEVPPGRGPRHLEVLCDKLDAVLTQADGDDSPTTDLPTCLHDAAERMGRRSMAMLLTDAYAELGELSRALQHARKNRQQGQLWHVLDAAERSLTASRIAMLEDVETGQKLMVDAKAAMEAYATALAAHQNGLRQQTAAAGWRYVDVDTRTPLAQLLRRSLAG